MATVKLDHEGTEWGLKREKGAEPYESSDPDTLRIWWSDVGVHQNMTFPVHPDPISGMHCWHQAVRVTRAEPGDNAGDVFVDTAEVARGLQEVAGDDAAGGSVFTRRHAPALLDAAPVEAGARVLQTAATGTATLHRNEAGSGSDRVAA